MSFFPAQDPTPGHAPSCDAIELVVVPRTSDLGGFQVRRALPTAGRLPPRHPRGRYIWWNFVSSRRERIEQAKTEWREGRFSPVPGEREFIPLPDKPRLPEYP